MAIVITQDLKVFQPSNNDSVMVVSGDTYDQSGVTDYRYILDVYEGETLLGTLKSFPDPQYQTGLFNLRGIASAATSFTLPPFEIDFQPFHQAPEGWADLSVSVGEEYFLGSTYVSNRNLLQPDYDYTYWNASVTWRQFVSGNYDYFYWQPADFDNDGFLTLWPQNQAFIYLPQYRNTQFKSWGYYFQEASGVTAAQITTYGSYEEMIDGNSLGVYQITNPYYGNKGIQNFGTSYVHLVSYDNGPVDVIAIEGDLPIITSDVEYYQVNMIGDDEVVSNGLYYRIYDECTVDTPINVYWLNEIGGIDSWRFYRKSQSLDKETASYKKIPGTLQSNGQYLYSTYDQSNVNFYTRVQEKMTIQTVDLTEYQIFHLKGLFSSPVVYIEDETGNRYAVTVDTTNYRLKKFPAEQLFNLSLDLTFSVDSYRQTQ